MGDFVCLRPRKWVEHVIALGGGGGAAVDVKGFSKHLIERTSERKRTCDLLQQSLANWSNGR